MLLNRYFHELLVNLVYTIVRSHIVSQIRVTVKLHYLICFWVLYNTENITYFTVKKVISIKYLTV